MTNEEKRAQKKWLDKIEARLLARGELKYLQGVNNVDKKYAVRDLYDKWNNKRADARQIKAA